MGAIDPRLDDLLRRLLAPARPRAAECLTIVEGCASGDEAWERLCARGVIEPSFALAPHRTFAAPIRTAAADTHSASRCREPECEHCSPIVWRRSALRAPRSTLAAASLASDPEGIATAESLARECASRLGFAQPKSFHWMIADPAALVWTAPTLAGLSSSAALPWEHWSESCPDPYTLSVGALGAFESALDDWLVAVTVGLYSTSASPTALAPYAALWNSGYALRSLEGDVAILGAPLLERATSVEREAPDEAAALRRAILDEANAAWVAVRAFVTEPATDDGLLESKLAALEPKIGTRVRWQRHEPREWCAQLARRFRWFMRPPSAVSILAAIERFAGGPYATVQAGESSRALSRALVGYEVAWSDTAAIVTDTRIFTVTTWYED
ncbi:MAG: hypothetical protein JNK05_32720 [Myxococcales bacterium]|nr:hypothetical protein [Myxococcales bacterium]